MDPTIKHQWTEALRSGQYPQGKEWLRNADGAYCCLGVLCELHRQTQDLTGLQWNLGRNDYAYYRNDCAYYYGDHGVFLPKAVLAWAGLEHKEEEVLEDLMCQNDDGVLFPTIADYIEEHL